MLITPHKVALVLLAAIALYLGAGTYLSVHRRQHAVPHIRTLSELQQLVETWEAQSGPGQAHMLAHLASELALAQDALAYREQSHQNPPPKGLLGSTDTTTSSSSDSSSRSSSSSSAVCDVEDSGRLLTALRRPCIPLPHTELGGEEVVAWGSAHKAVTAAECCAACHAWNAVAEAGGHEKGKETMRCNVWVWCGQAGACGQQYQECWLKHASKPPAPTELPLGGSSSRADVPWTSGVVYPDPDAYLEAVKGKTKLLMHTPLGVIPIQLLPDLAPRSVAELQRGAAFLLPRQGYCSGCNIYRNEAKFLLQGVISAPGVYVAGPRHPNPPQRKVMQRGLICWAGGAGGPDWFINLIDQSGFGDDHLCWGLVDQGEGMALVDRIVGQPLAPKKNPSDMTYLATRLYFNLTLE